MNSLVDRIRRMVERALPWYDPAERDRRAARTKRQAQHAIAVRIRTEEMMAREDARLGSYRRVRLGR